LQAADESIGTSARVGHGIRTVVFRGVEFNIGIDRCVAPPIIRRPIRVVYGAVGIIRRSFRVAYGAVGIIRRSFRVACARAGVHAHVTRTRDIGNDGTVRISVRMRVSTVLPHVCGVDHSAARIGLRAPRVCGAGRVAGSGVPEVAVGRVVKEAVTNGVGHRRVSGIASIRGPQSQERISTAERA
jgi:hypothetical protein